MQASDKIKEGREIQANEEWAQHSFDSCFSLFTGVCLQTLAYAYGWPPTEEVLKEGQDTEHNHGEDISFWWDDHPCSSTSSLPPAGPFVDPWNCLSRESKRDNTPLMETWWDHSSCRKLCISLSCRITRPQSRVSPPPKGQWTNWKQWPSRKFTCVHWWSCHVIT